MCSYHSVHYRLRNEDMESVGSIAMRVVAEILYVRATSNPHDSGPSLISLPLKAGSAHE